METKKNPKANLEGQKLAYILGGLALTLVIILSAFEYATKPEEIVELQMEEVDMIEETILNTQKPPEEPPPPPPQEEPPEVFELEAVDNSVEVEDIQIDVETDAEETIEIPDEIEVPDEEPVEEQIFFIVEEMPIFRPEKNKTEEEGKLDLLKYVAENLEYPQQAVDMQIQGKVFVRFEVTKKGKVGKVEILRGVNPLLDKEAERVVRNLPDWKAGRQRNQEVNVWYTLPVIFRLEQ